MSDLSTNVVSIRDVYDIVGRIETKVDTRFAEVDSKVDGLAARIDRLDGAISIVKWLGPAGLAALLAGLLKAAGYF